MARKKRSAGGARPIKVGEQVRQALAEMLREGVFKDPRLETASLVTITEVKMTPELKLGRVYVSVYGADDAGAVIEGLNSAAKTAQREIGARLKLRHTPKLEFARDDSIAYGAKIEALLQDIHREDE